MSATKVPIVPLAKERLFPRPERLEPGVWLQGVSVGEVQIALDLAARLAEKRDGLPLLLTASTPAGLALLRKRAQGLSGKVATRAFPLDLAPSVSRFFETARPRLLVLVETELWPNVLAQAGRRGVPVLLVSARLSERSLRWYARAKGLFAGALRSVSRVLARTEEDAARFRELGIAPERVEVGGDLKLDRPLPPEPPFAAEVRRLAAGRAIVVAGSLADEEISVVRSVGDALRKGGVDALLLVAPRRPESFRKVEEMLREGGTRVVARSRPSTNAPAERPDVFLLDSVGELAAAYRLGDVALLGGTFAPRGGHNLVEPLRAGLPTVLGPSRHGIRHLVERAEGAVFSTADGAGAARVVSDLLRDGGKREAASAAASRLFMEHAGGLERAAAAVLSLLDETA